jgi:hypothetical protein
MWVLLKFIFIFLMSNFDWPITKKRLWKLPKIEVFSFLVFRWEGKIGYHHFWHELIPLPKSVSTPMYLLYWSLNIPLQRNPKIEGLSWVWLDEMPINTSVLILSCYIRESHQKSNVLGLGFMWELGFRI